ncbi:hypothetical protein NZ45_15950 [Clostridium botulinum]|uniref:Polymerase nucleotidyl transferase domain-containing protein n=1 Tax=Clostridium botulinum TaxID=1491 RepID=A0ABD7CI36_CLOBO|nr:hypothetical protein [Clostridium botulinum]KGO12754.1 hypothetical protein NZ45_15950 [Clostridium botulinum]QRI52834.1 hypothetical protein JQS73_15560 [Clostridium botulinum]
MAIPDFTIEGILPMGIYDASLNNIKEKFCSIGDVSKRNKLYNIFIRYLECLKKHKVEFEVYLDGSFVTNKVEPGDIDVLLFYDNEYYNDKWEELIFDDLVRIKFPGIHVLSAFLESDGKDFTLDFAHDVSDKPGLRKGLIRVIL